MGSQSKVGGGGPPVQSHFSFAVILVISTQFNSVRSQYFGFDEESSEFGAYWIVIIFLVYLINRYRQKRLEQKQNLNQNRNHNAPIAVVRTGNTRWRDGERR